MGPKINIQTPAPETQDPDSSSDPIIHVEHEDTPQPVTIQAIEETHIPYHLPTPFYPDTPPLRHTSAPQ